MNTQKTIDGGQTSDMGKHWRVPQGVLLTAGLMLSTAVFAADDHGHEHEHEHAAAHWIGSGHTGLALHYDELNGLEAFVVDPDDGGHHYDEDGHDEHGHGEGLNPAEVVFVVGGAAHRIIGDAPELAFLEAGEAGVYQIGQSRERGLPFFGFETEELSATEFIGDIRIELELVEGPGRVALYTVGGLGEVSVFWDSAGSEANVYALPAGTHRHFYLSFSEAGDYKLHLHISADKEGMDQPLETEVVLHFEVGGMHGYFAEFLSKSGDWLEAPFPGWVYTHEWPWFWSRKLGWLYAYGHGGFEHLYYSNDLESWIYTDEPSFPWVFNWANNAWEFTGS